MTISSARCTADFATVNGTPLSCQFPRGERAVGQGIYRMLLFEQDPRVEVVCLSVSARSGKVAGVRARFFMRIIDCRNQIGDTIYLIKPLRQFLASQRLDEIALLVGGGLSGDIV